MDAKLLSFHFADGGDRNLTVEQNKGTCRVVNNQVNICINNHDKSETCIYIELSFDVPCFSQICLSLSKSMQISLLEHFVFFF